MVSKTFTSAVAAAVLGSSLVSAQTSTSCNPLQKTCPADPAFGGVVTCDFTKGACDAFHNLDGTSISYGSNGATFTITKGTDAPTIMTDKYIFFGRIDVTMQAAPEQGIVTSVVLESDDLDEIDWEWVGADNAQAQTNYFAKGNTATYNRGGFSPVSNPLGSFHTYSIEWTSSAINWLIDNTVVRTVTPADAAATGNQYPQTPMQVKLGTWNAGAPGGAEGTRQWAGGYTDFSKAPFIAYYKSITITDYAGGNKAASGNVKEYTYGDHSGSWQSIKVDGGSPSGGSASSSSSPSSSAAASSSKAPASTAQSSSVSSAASSAASSGAASSSAAPTTMSSATQNQSSSTTTRAPTTVPTANGASSNSKAATGALVVALAAGFAAQLL